MRLRHAEPLRRAGSSGRRNSRSSRRRPRRARTAMSFADFTISILSALSTVTSGADREAHLDRRLHRRVGRDRQQLVERDAAFLDGAQRHIGGHDLGDRRPGTTARWRSRRAAPCRCRPRPGSTPRPPRGRAASPAAAQADEREKQRPKMSGRLRTTSSARSGRWVGPRKRGFHRPEKVGLSKPKTGPKAKERCRDPSRLTRAVNARGEGDQDSTVM